VSGDAIGRLLRSMLGPPEPSPGPPFTHVHVMPETEEEIAAQPYLPTMTVERREPCRYCGQEVILGKHGWRLDNNSPAGYGCADAPRGYHGVTRSSQPAAARRT
jgi:hypothetical protein